MNKFKTIICGCFLLTLTACDTGFQTMGASEYGVIFSALPPTVGGGVRDKIVAPGETQLIMPWEELYRIDTSVRSIAWGSPQGGTSDRIDYLETRAQDGNEVGLAMTVRYKIDPKKVDYVVQNVGLSNENIDQLIEAVTRSDIRTFMNELKTLNFFDASERGAAVDRLRNALNARLMREGIIVDEVIYNDHRFQGDYQALIDQTQAKREETQQERKKVATVVEQKKQELNEAQARVNRMIAEAEGLKRQATLRGDAYLEAKRNEAEQIRSIGLAEVEGLTKKVEALSGPGGEALLRLELVKALLKRDPQFVLVNSSDANGMRLDLNKLDTNALIQQSGAFAAGIAEGLKDEPSLQAEIRKKVEVQ